MVVFEQVRKIFIGVCFCYKIESYPLCMHDQGQGQIYFYSLAHFQQLQEITQCKEKLKESFQKLDQIKSQIRIKCFQ